MLPTFDHVLIPVALQESPYQGVSFHATLIADTGNINV
jgi:hypothetical protein